MAEKVDKMVAAVLPLSVEGDKKKQQQQAHPSVLIDLLPPLRDVILWTIFHAGNITFSVAVGAAYHMLLTIFGSNNPPATAEHLPAPAPGQPSSSSWLPSRDVEVEITGAEATEVLALAAGILWCAVPQVSAGLLALMLPSHRRRLRLLLAYAGLVLTVPGHCMFARVIRIIVTVDPGRLFFRVVDTAAIINLGFDLFYFLGLVLRGGEE